MQGSITRVESLTKNGNIVAYEAQVVTGKKHSEIQVDQMAESSIIKIYLFEKGVAACELPPNPFEALAWGMVDLIGGANEMQLDGVAII